MQRQNAALNSGRHRTRFDVHKHAKPFSRICVKRQSRKSAEAALCSSTDTDARFHGIPYSANQRFSA